MSFLGMKNKSRHSQGGYTIIEILSAILIAGIGFMGILALQTAQIRTVRASFDTVSAVNCAEQILEILRQESIEWTVEPGDPLGKSYSDSSFKYLNLADAYGNASAWQVLTPVMTGLICGDPAYVQGVSSQDSKGNRKFCVHLRLTWLIQNFLMRADVRVMWPLDARSWDVYGECALGMEEAVGEVQSVTLSNTVMKNIFITKFE